MAHICGVGCVGPAGGGVGQREEGAVSSATVWWYLKQCGAHPGALARRSRHAPSRECAVNFSAFVAIGEALRITLAVWYTYWSDHSGTEQSSASFASLGVATALGFIGPPHLRPPSGGGGSGGKERRGVQDHLWLFLRGLAVVEASREASASLHEWMLSKVLNAPLRPAPAGGERLGGVRAAWRRGGGAGWQLLRPESHGRVLARFSRDLESLDASVAEQLVEIGSVAVMGR